MDAAAGRTPVSVITGCLGSGKTTLLNHVLRDPAFADAAVIINEFGEIALDHLLVTAPDESMVVLGNGCICCEMRGDLVGTLAGLYLKRRQGGIPAFGRVLIETTGLADPVPILQTLVTDRELAPLYRTDSIVTLVDAVHGESQLEAGAEAVKQAALADRLLVSKCDLAPAGAYERLRERLALLNPGAEIHSVTRGAIDPERLFGAGPDDAARGAGLARWLNADGYRDAAGSHYRPVDGGVSAFCVYHDRPVTRAGLALWLNLLASMRGAQLLRFKGLLNVEGEPVVVQAVQTLVHEPVTLERWPDAERRSRLVFITRGMAPADIERTLPALAFEDAGPGAPGGFDAAAYARFTAIAGNFR